MKLILHNRLEWVSRARSMTLNRKPGIASKPNDYKTLRVWEGSPLFTHKRCSSPGFSMFFAW